MKIKPYFKFGYMTFEGNQSPASRVIPIDICAINFSKNQTVDSLIHDSNKYEFIYTESNELIHISDLHIKSVPEFWLKMYTLGCVFEADDNKPTEPEKEICCLNIKIKELEEKIQKYKDTLKLIYTTASLPEKV